MTHPIIKTDNYILITSDEEKKHEIKQKFEELVKFLFNYRDND